MGAGASSLGVYPVYLCHACQHTFFPFGDDVSNGRGVANRGDETTDATRPGRVTPACPECGSDFLELGRAVHSDVADAVRAAADGVSPMVRRRLRSPRCVDV